MNEILCLDAINHDPPSQLLPSRIQAAREWSCLSKIVAQDSNLHACMSFLLELRGLLLFLHVGSKEVKCTFCTEGKK